MWGKTMKRKLAAVLLLVALLGLPAWSGIKSGGNTGGTISLDKPYLSFGSQGVGTVSSVQTSTITNNTSYPFAFTSISAETAFTVALTDCGYLQPKQSCTVQVAFVPLHAGTYVSRLNLGAHYSSAALVVALYGTGQ
jgi:hypothetical protein